MPYAALHYCPGSPTCQNKVAHGYCPEHARPAWTHRAPVKRITGHRLQRMRLDLWAKDPHCQQCRRLVAMHQMIRDHIIPLAEGGKDEEANTQVLCFDCSDAKSQAEAQRGQARQYGYTYTQQRR